MPSVFNDLKTTIATALFIVLSAFIVSSCKQENSTPEKAIQATLVLEIDSFSLVIRQFQSALNSGSSEKQLQDLFLRTRLSYKRFEWAAEYFAPTITRFVNGPPVPEAEITGGPVFDPEGMQVMEGLLFPKYNLSHKKELLQRLKLLQSNAGAYNIYFKNIDILDWQIFDATKLEVFRILTLGITGFDNPLTLNSMAECRISLKSTKTVLSYFADHQHAGDLIEKFTAANSYLQQHTNFNSFNRAVFITAYGNPITTAITHLQQHSPIPVVKYNRLLNQDAKTLFDAAAYNINAYTPGPSYFVTDKKIALGKKLFSDPLLSGTKTRSCASCHRPDHFFTDDLVKNTAINGKGLLRRNTPTLLNAALQPSQFYDLRANTLEDQATDVIQNKNEMHGDMQLLIKQLWQDKTYRTLFAAAFPTKERTAIDTLEVTNALGSYIRSLTLLNSRFDDYMRGNKAAMKENELNGFNLFMGKAKCATCHYMPLFNGTLPPKYLTIETEVIGVPESRTSKAIDKDLGRFDFMAIPSAKHAFKINTVRNTAQTAPYMHNGIFKTLDEVVDFYNKGGGAGIGIKIDNQTLSSDQLHLTPKETSELIAFIKSLDSK